MLYNKKQSIPFYCLGKFLGLLFFPLILDLTAKLKNPYSSASPTVHTHTSPPAAKRKSNAFIQQRVPAVTRHPRFPCAKTGLLKGDFSPSPEAWWHLGYVPPRVTGWPWQRTWPCLSPTPAAAAFSPTAALSGLYLAKQVNV